VGRDLDGHQQHDFAGWIAVADIVLPLDGARCPALDVGTEVPAVTDGALVGKQTIDNDIPLPRSPYGSAGRPGPTRR